MEAENQMIDNQAYIKEEPLETSDFGQSASLGSILPHMETAYPRNDMLAMQENYWRTQTLKDMQSNSQPAVAVSDAVNHSSSLAGYSHGGLPLLKPGNLNTNRNFNLEAGFPSKTRKKATTAPPGMGKRSHLPKRYVCGKCAYRTRYKSDLNRHTRKHNVAAYSCEVCNMPFKTMGNVEVHKRKEHPEKCSVGVTKQIDFKCQVCPFETAYFAIFQHHLREHAFDHNEDNQCDVCKKSFQSVEQLEQHFANAHNMGEFSKKLHYSTSEQSGGGCSMYVKTSGTDDSEHVVIINDENSHNDVALNENSEIEYVNDIKLDDMYVNDISGEQTNEELVAEHSSQGISASDICPENSDNKHVCSECNMKFNRRILLDIHLKKVHKKYTEISTDFYTDKSFNLVLDLSAQEPARGERKGNTTVAKRRHQCPYCTYSSPYKSTCDRHVRKHEVGSYLCPICCMPFIVKGNLSRHMRENHSNTEKSDGLIASAVNVGQIAKMVKDSMTENGNKVQDKGQEALNHAAKNKNLSMYKINDSCKLDERSDHSSSVLSQPPSSGRYAKLVSDFDDFTRKPFACALCFFRTNNTNELFTHVQNHVTGCNFDPIPESAIMNFSGININSNTQQKIYLPPALQVLNNVSFSMDETKDGAEQSSQVNKSLPDNTAMRAVTSTTEATDEVKPKSTEKMPQISTFERAKRFPLVCLPCKKRFKTTKASKLHYRQKHGKTH